MKTMVRGSRARRDLRRSLTPLRLLALAPLLLVAACSPVTPALRGVVQAAPRPCGPAAVAPPSPPLAGATVKLLCPGREPAPTLTGTTDARGHFELVTAAAIPYGCRVELTREGYAPRSYPVEDLCAEAPRGMQATVCTTVVLTAQLAPARGGKP